ncbi:MAG: thiamine diphosphokinase [Rubricella sp.]
MAERIAYRFDEPVLIAGGGGLDAAALSRAERHAGRIVAADGAADALFRLGRMPSLIVGDLDSLASRDDWRARGVPLHRLEEQETTDFEKVLYSVDAPLFLAAGFTGRRLDHALAVLRTVAFEPRPVILVGEHDAIFAVRGSHGIALPEGTRFSLFPMATARGLSSEGLRWPIEGLDFAPWGRVGTSNVVTRGPVRICVEGSGMLAMVPVNHLDAVVASIATGEENTGS